MSGQNYSVISAARSRMASVRFMGRHASLTELRSAGNVAEVPCNRQQAQACDRRNQKEPEVVGCPWSPIGHVGRGKHGGLDLWDCNGRRWDCPADEEPPTAASVPCAQPNLRLCYANECGSRFEWSPHRNRFDIQYATLGHGERSRLEHTDRHCIVRQWLSPPASFPAHALAICPRR